MTTSCNNAWKLIFKKKIYLDIVARKNFQKL